jgi:hypothetical protein
VIVNNEETSKTTYIESKEYKKHPPDGDAVKQKKAVYSAVLETPKERKTDPTDPAIWENVGGRDQRERTGRISETSLGEYGERTSRHRRGTISNQAFPQPPPGPLHRPPVLHGGERSH